MSDNDFESRLAAREAMASAGLYDASEEHDACGVGLIAVTDGKARREVIDQALFGLAAVTHRGAVAADGLSGDGAGVRIAIDQSIARKYVERTGHNPHDYTIGIGMIFLPRREPDSLEQARTIVESEMVRAGLTLFGWRAVPVDPSVLGSHADAMRPNIEQILFRAPSGHDEAAVERELYLVRRRIEKRALAANLKELYVCSLSRRDVVYKGMFLSNRIADFYPDLKDEDWASDFAILHQRFSTNTFPEWRLAQPFRLLAHNGEINTLKANVRWMKSHEIRMASDAFGEDCEAVKPVIQPGSSDSAALDQAFELLVRAGRSVPMAKALLIPEAWSKRAGLMPEETRALYAYCNAVMEPWDGPAAIAACDGQWAIAGLDRNGLRPLRWTKTRDGLVLVGSETGMYDIADARVERQGALGPGRAISVNLITGEFFSETEHDARLSQVRPFSKWLKQVEELDPVVGPGPEARIYSTSDLHRRQRAAGISREDMEKLLQPMVETGKEATGSMGDDSPLAVLSEQPRPFAHFFRQNFSQVTNPPIDYLREDRVMSLKTRFKNLGNILLEDETQTDVFTLESPILTNGMYERMRARFGEDGVEIDATFDAAGSEANGLSLKRALDRVREEAEAAIKGGAEHLFLTDEHQGAGRAAIPSALAVSAVHSHLASTGWRSFCSLNVRSGEVLDPHSLALLIGAGATTVSPYLAFEALAERHERGLFGDTSLGECVLNYKAALEGGLMKIMARLGISIVSSYRGGLLFEAIGLSRALVDEFFPGVSSRISGIGLKGLERRLIAANTEGWIAPESPPRPGGFYGVRSGEERHVLSASIIEQLQTAVRTRDRAAYEGYEALIDSQAPMQLRDLLKVTALGPELPLDEVEPVSAIVKRFLTPGMSLGALSPEAHGALNIAMNRLGARSVSGEGGEDRARYTLHANGDDENSRIKQIASGRFGVTAEYLNKCTEVEIKVAQGAKPGEGGQLPGFKVNAYIAKLRHATPGTTLISPPPHHDIYSIEDLAQLIYDLKQINPDARVTVKLVSRAGVGTIAAGVAKAHADTILISGNVGGTGASPLSSIKFAGAPWELGLAEAHQMLTINGLRSRVRLRTDGGLRTGRDILIAALLGAEEYGIGTVALLALGCLMVRQCHSNTCPVGICTQDETLRKHFPGLPDHVVNLMTYLAESVRQHLASIGARSLGEVIGRADLLSQETRGNHDLDDLDLGALHHRAGHVDSSVEPGARNAVPDTLDHRVLERAAPVFESSQAVTVEEPIGTADRTAGALLSSKIVRQYGPDGLADRTLTLKIAGSAGQSLGAFAAKGLAIDLLGAANDYVGKGLSGGEITICPAVIPISKRIVLLGNACLYGATSGRLFAAGAAGARFAVRNSGATAVIEGCAAHGCEYMTGGTVVILGRVGDNFAAGLTGGEVYVLDTAKRLDSVLNPDTATIKTPDEAALARVKTLVETHLELTGSKRARECLENWDATVRNLRLVCPADVPGEAPKAPPTRPRTAELTAQPDGPAH
ncbi:glutamate synthase large subunit [Marinicauda pacifica]|uniref:glutamate synthase large subunit n=1 Tax=Marinicauda pacifica TaxID=1133559 RepID=UPI0035C79F27